MLARSGLITATAEETTTALIIRAPLCFDEETVAAEGSWSFPAGTDVAEALEDVYIAEFAGWCRRKEEIKASEIAEITRRRAAMPRMHTPCPALWAGR